MLVLIKGAGDIATGIALRLYRSGIHIVMTELEQPSSIRRTVCFSEAVRLGTAEVEGIRAVRCVSVVDAREFVAQGSIPILCDPLAACCDELHPDVLVDAILAKINTGTTIADAPTVIAVGPGFTAGTDCHAVIETMRGHTLGRPIYFGSALPNTGIPGEIGGFGRERVMHSECGGTFHAVCNIGDTVKAGETVAFIGDVPLKAKIPGTLRGLLPDGFEVPREGFKSADVDPRCELFHCFTASDKALAVGGGVLEAILALTGALKKEKEM